MRKIGLLILGVTFHLFALSQSPAGFSYQGVLRNTEGQVLANIPASLMVSLTSSNSVDVYYSETHSLTTNTVGLFSIVVGQGTATSGSLSSVPWSQGGVYLKLDVKPDGAASYVSMGLQQLQSVPYALYAADGLCLNWLGEFPAPPADPVKNQSYYNSTDKKSYIWDGDSWEIIAMDGLPGLVGEVGPQGSQGIQGIQGEAGPQGIQGEVGPKGDQGVQGEIGQQGPQGLQGEVGPEGPRGPAGVGLTLRGNWSPDSTYIEGDYVFDESSGTVGVNSMWICQNPVGPSVSHPKDDSTSWVEFEAPEGPQGPQGPEGPLVAGIAGQTLRHDGTTWVANSMLYNNGTNIGIGTTAPDKILTVKSLTTNTQIAKFADDARYIGIGRDEVGSYDLSGNLAGLYLNQGKLYVGSNGNVGVGTTNPGSYRLYVHGGDLMVNRGDGLGGNIRIAGHSFVGSADWGTLFLASGTNNGNTSIRFITENAERMYVIGNGNVGIGAWPSHRFHVSGGNGVINNVFMGDVGHGANWAALANSSSANTTGYALLQSGDGLYTLLNRKSGAGYIGFRIDNIDQMVIANSGYVGIGTNGPDAKLKIENGGFAIGQGSATNDTYGGYRTIQLSTQNGINGGTYDNHTGALLWSTLESGGWGDARLKIALGTNWGVYNIANPAMVIGQNFLGVGTSTAGARMVVQGSATAAATEPLFEVKDKNGNPVFIVYQDSVRIIVKDGITKDSKGIFAVSGRNTSKALTNNFLMITPDKARVWTGDPNLGFAAENIVNSTKQQYTKLTPKNSLIGHLSGISITTGVDNTFMGTEAGQRVTTGYENVIIGKTAGVFTTEGYKNTFIGESAGYYNVSGHSNTFIGQRSGGANTTGFYNVYIGERAGDRQNGRDNTFIGYYCGRGTSGSVGNYNTAYGAYAGYVTYGAKNLFLGDFAGYSNTSGAYNTFVGSESGYYCSTGTYNSSLGYGAFRNGAAYTNSTAIGYNAAISASNQIRIGNSSVTSIGGYAAWSNLSDIRLKKEVKSNVPGLDFILKLRPITYYLDMDKIAKFLNTADSLRLFESEKDKASQLQTGFAAQEVEEAAKSLGYDFSGIDRPKNANDYYSLRYSEFTVPLVKAVQELSTEVDSQKKIIEQQNILIDELIKRIERLEIKMKSTPSETVSY